MIRKNRITHTMLIKILIGTATVENSLEVKNKHSIAILGMYPRETKMHAHTHKHTCTHKEMCIADLLTIAKKH